MGFLGLAPFTNAGAVYDPVQQVLTISAQGEAQKFTYGYFFKRVVPWVGGLRFELYAWTGPLSHGTEPFEVSQPFNIPNLQVGDPSNTIILVGSNHPSGEIIEIKWLGLKPPVGNGQSLPKRDKKLSTDTPQPPQTLDAETPARINTLYKEPFTISERAYSGPGATLNMDFDPQFLMLTRAGIEGGDLVWTFNSLETGITQVVTYSTEGLGTPVIRKVYTVKVFVLDSAARQSSDSSQGNGVVSNLAVTNGQNGKNGATSKPDAILSFLGRVFEAQRIAQGALPSARLLRVQATLPAGPVYPVTDPLRLSQLDVLFVGDNNEYATVKSTGWGEWALPVVKKGTPIVGLQTFAVEDCKVEITQADEAVRAEVGMKAFFEVTLARPLGAPQYGPYNPLYTFQMIDTSVISVDAVTGKILGN
ncbi:hypothetical protein INS49_001280 [Diaporthe citri]|uniref:uncharacterized protein n=1 Tax=Diaporthe citri TaxID=83186 RepID=UPI001C813F56|nr:uncharacterized protein INS49_001280 [Diaporthe citri]KAG6367098.1 hypothetical protein INS49_001280 [Diaporthe citri]